MTSQAANPGAPNPVLPNTTSAGPIRAQVHQIIDNSVEVSIPDAHGIPRRYKVSFFNQTTDTEVSTSDNKLKWIEIAKEATNIALGIAKKDAIYKADVVLSGIQDQSDPNQTQTTASNLHLESASIQETTFSTLVAHDVSSTEITQIAQSRLTELGQKLANPRLSASTPISSTPPSNSTSPAQTNSSPVINSIPTQDEIIDPVAELCMNRKRREVSNGSGVSQAGIHYAIADQIKSLSNQNIQTKYPGNTDQVATKLITEYAEHIYPSGLLAQTTYHNGDKFTKILTALKQIEAFPSANLEKTKLMNSWNSHKGSIAMSLTDLLATASLTESQKKTLVKTYSEYLKSGGTILNQDSFLSVFTEINNDIQVALKKQNSPKTVIYPASTNQITPSKCLFLHLDQDNKTYRSFVRDKEDSHGIIDLNTARDPIDVRANTIRKLPYIKQTKSDGRCLDLSIAYDAKKKKLPIDQTIDRDEVNEPTAKWVESKAQRLRADVKQHLIGQHNSFANDVVFMKLLVNSIKEIPAFKNQNYESIKLPDASGTGTLPAICTQAEFNECARIVTAYSLDNPSATSLPDKIKLIEFYEKYINEKHADGIAKNYLDNTFIYVLNKAKPSINVAITDDIEITATIPETDIIDMSKLADWTVIKLSKPGNAAAHYEPFIRDNLIGKNKFQEMAKRKNERFQTELMNNFLSTLQKEDTARDASPADLVNAFARIKDKHPKAYQAFAGKIYAYDHQKWEENGRQGDEPGTKVLNCDGNNYPAAYYGDWRLATLMGNPPQFKATIKLLPA